MSPSPREFFTTWYLDWGALLFLGALGLAYFLGWGRLRVGGYRALATVGRLASFLTGLSGLVLAFLSPVRAFEGDLFALKMLQHQLLLLVGAPFLLLSYPLPFLLWGLPAGLRRGAALLLGGASPLRRALTRALRPWPLLGLFTATVWFWHLPPVYRYGLDRPGVHFLEHASILVMALVFWWFVTGAPPRWRRPLPHTLRALYTFGAYVQNQVLGVGIILLGRALFHAPGEARLWGIPPLQDQSLGGAVMWVPGELTYAATAIVLVTRLLGVGQEGREPFRGVAQIYEDSEVIYEDSEVEG